MKFTILHKIIAGILLTSITTALIVLPLTVGGGSVENKPETSNKNENKSENSVEGIKEVEEQGAKSDYVYLYTIANTFQKKAPKNIDHTNKNFQCKFLATEKFDCEISKLKDNDQKRYELGKVESWINDRPTKEELSQKGQIFQIKFEGKYWEKVPNIKDDFSIISKEFNDQKYFYSYEWFATYKDEKARGVFNSFIIQSKQDDLIDEDVGCLHSDNISRSSHSWEKCYLYKFNEEEQAKAGFSSLKFKPVEISKEQRKKKYQTFKTGQYYLIKFGNIKDIDEDLSKIYFLEDPYATTKKHMFEGLKRIKAFYSPTHDHVFILE